MRTEVRLAKTDLKRPAAPRPVTMQSLWRLVFWGAAAASTMLIAVLAGRGAVASQRAALAASVLAGHNVASVQPSQPPPKPAVPAFDARAETQRLADEVRELVADNAQLKSRLAAVEHAMDDVTGSIAKVAAKATAATSSAPAAAPAPTTPPWPNGPAVPATPASISAVVSPALPMPIEYGADIGSATSIQALRARWAGIRSAHPDLFSGMTPSVTLRATPRSNRPELRLIVGPFADPKAADTLCATLALYRLSCHSTIFAGQHLALE